MVFLKKSKTNMSYPTERGGTKLLDFLIKYLGLRIVYLGCPFVLWYFYLSRKNSRLGIIKLYRRIGKTAFSAWFLAYRNYLYFAYSLIDKIGQRHGSEITIEHSKRSPGGITHSSGAILVGSHFGDWSLSGKKLGNKSGASISIVMDPHISPEFQKRANTLESVAIIDARRDSFDILIEVKKKLDANGIVCFLADRITNKETRQLRCDFFGEPVAFPTSPFELAFRLKIPIYSFFCTRKSLSFRPHYEILSQSLSLPGESASAQEILQKFVWLLEENVRKNPAHWFNFFDFWATHDSL